MPAQERGVLLTVVMLLTGCTGSQSTLDPAGKGAEQIADLFWWMLGGATLIWIVMIGLTIYCLLLNPVAHHRRKSALFIIGGGVIAPTLILTTLLIFSLSLLPPLLARPPKGSLQVEVEGRQWWWRVRYPDEKEGILELANEIYLPRGEPVEFLLSSSDVVHSFWIPALGGKVDMIPGRTTRLTLHPTRVGTYRGICAEYCGESHAFMNLTVVVVERDEFDQWLARQRADRVEQTGQAALLGEAVFLQSGCGACHSVRGTDADGTIGPDLTHVGSRQTLGAGLLTTDRAHYRNWITETSRLKPGVKMPEFRALTEEQLANLVTYLDNLK